MFAKHFSLSNLPYGIATSETHYRPSIVTRVQDNVYFLWDIVEKGLLNDDISASTAQTIQEPTLNAFAALPRKERQTFRSVLQRALKEQISSIPTECIEHIDNVKMHLPIKVGEFTDFSCSKEHQYNSSEVGLGTRRLPPSFANYPPAYAGRASSIVVSGTPIKRPKGQYRNDKGEAIYEPTQALDYELELACIIGKPSKLGEPVPASQALDHIFGIVLLNDWSARDMQAMEMLPLGPFSSKSFGTSISPWIVTIEALEPFRIPLPTRDMPVAQYLSVEDHLKSSYDIQLKAELLNEASLTKTICESKFESVYWSFEHFVAQQTVSGAALNNGDILGTGTISGSTRESLGCLFELTRGGKEGYKVEGEDGERTYFRDGDSIRISAFAGEEGAGVGFGDCTGLIIS
ncbi:fumarylacetoacetase [Melanomma pulvis-pyrius CBS 109.77]|uniref:Fumarylacetoacetase n=1 Tax=Melanomma pulvis-pyrius CBS 109.77 TaxID=1314802 RepID=A0A6A6XMA7_9PLEO|nr:fumarylacetoacetase [Melanomma pulvis-pyrius CBS 109.77]